MRSPGNGHGTNEALIIRQLKLYQSVAGTCWRSQRVRGFCNVLVASDMASKEMCRRRMFLKISPDVLALVTLEE